MRSRGHVLAAAVVMVTGLLGGSAGAAPITFSEVSNGLSGTLIFADVSLDGTLVNASTGDQTGIASGNYVSGGTWGRVDSSYGANNTTPAGNKDGLNLNILEGQGSSPALKWTVSSGRGDGGGNGAGSLLANTSYNVHVHYMTHTTSTQNWGGEMSTSATFAAFDQFDRDDGIQLTTVGTSNVDYRRFQMTVAVTTDAGGNAELFIRRPTSGTHVRTMIDGVVFEQLAAPPPPPVLVPLAQFDFNDAGSPNQAGFESLNADLASSSATQNGITLTVLGMPNLGRDRGAGGNVAGSPLPDVTRDFICTDNGRGYATPYLTVTLDGLLPNTEYDLRWHHFDNGSADSQNRLALYLGSALPGNLLFETGSYASNTLNYFTDFSAFSDAQGRILLVTGPHSAGRSIQMLNGLEVFAPDVIPEPATLVLLALAGCGLGGYARRRTGTRRR